MFLAFGYPQNRVESNRSRRRTITHPLAFVSNIAPPISYRKAKLNLTQHVALEFNAHAAIGPRGIGPAPMVSGMSGGGVFRLPGLERRGDRSPQLSAILIEHLAAHRLMVGVRIDTVLTAIDWDRGRTSSINASS